MVQAVAVAEPAHKAAPPTVFHHATEAKPVHTAVSPLAAVLPRSVVQAAAEPPHKAASPTVFHHATAAKPAHTAASPSAAALRTTANGAYEKLLSEFPAVQNPSKQLPPVKHDVVHH
jgi:hypothetical protein